MEATILYRPRDSNLFLLESILPQLKCIDKGEGTESLVYCHLRGYEGAVLRCSLLPFHARVRSPASGEAQRRGPGHGTRVANCDTNGCPKKKNPPQVNVIVTYIFERKNIFSNGYFTHFYIRQMLGRETSVLMDMQ